MIKLTSVAMVPLVLVLCGCAPVGASRCSIRVGHAGHLIATVTLTNHSDKEIVHAEVLADLKRIHGQDGNRLFEAVTYLVPGETRSVEGREADDASSYDFKDFTSGGCELEQAIFADGTDWEQPSPL